MAEFNSPQVADMQQKINLQFVYLASDEIIDPIQSNSQVLIKEIPGVSAISDPKILGLYKQRFRAYDTLIQILQSYQPQEPLSDQQQLAYVQSVKRDISSFLTQCQTQHPTHESPSNLFHKIVPSNLLAELAQKTLIASFHILRSDFGRSISASTTGKLIRLFTNILFNSGTKKLVVLTLWIIGGWNFNPDSLLLTSRHIEAKERSEDPILVSEGWPAFMSWTCFSPEINQMPSASSSSGGNIVNFIGISTSFTLCSQLPMVTDGEVTARLVSLIDGIAWTFLSPSWRTSPSVAIEALKSLQNLQNRITLVDDLCHRWAYAILPILYFPATHAPCLPKVRSLLSHLAQRPTFKPNSFMSNILSMCMNQIPRPDFDPIEAERATKTQPQPAGTNHLIHTLGQNGVYLHLWDQFSPKFESQNTEELTSAIMDWGVFSILLGQQFFSSDLINRMLKLMQPHFSNIDETIRSSCFDSWKLLLLAFERAKGGIHHAKRLRLVMLPISRAFLFEDSTKVLNSAWGVYQTLIESIRKEIWLDWSVLLGHPFLLILKNPIALLRSNTNSQHSNTSTQAGMVPDQTKSSEKIPFIVSILDRFCLLICSILKDVPFHHMQSAFNPHRLERLVPLDSNEEKSATGAFWNMSVLEIELLTCRSLANEQEIPSSNLGIPLPSPSNPSYSHSLLSFVTCLMSAYLEFAQKSLDSMKADSSSSTDFFIEKYMPRLLFESLCRNVWTGTQRRASKSDISDNIEVQAWNQNVNAQSLLAWFLLQLSTVNTLRSLRKTNGAPFKPSASNVWHDFETHCFEYLVASYPQMVVNSNGEAPSILEKYLLFILRPAVFHYPPKEPNQTHSMAAEYDYSHVFLTGVDVYFNSKDLVHYSLEQVEKMWHDQAMLSTAKEELLSKFSCGISSLTSTLSSGFNSVSWIHNLIKKLGSVDWVSEITAIMPSAPDRDEHSMDVSLTEDQSYTLTSFNLRLGIIYHAWRQLSAAMEKGITEHAFLYAPQFYITSNSAQTTKVRSTSPVPNNNVDPTKGTSTLPTQQPAHPAPLSPSSQSNLDSSVVPESFKTKDLCKPLLDVILFPMRVSAALVTFHGGLSHFGSTLLGPSTLTQSISSVLNELFTFGLLEDIKSSWKQLVQAASRVAKTRYVELPIQRPNRTSANASLKQHCTTSLSTIIFLVLSKAVQRLEDHQTTSMTPFPSSPVPIDTVTSTQSTSSTSSNTPSKTPLRNHHIETQVSRIWLLSFRTEALAMIGVELCSTPALHIAKSWAAINEIKNLVTYSSTDLSVFSEESKNFQVPKAVENCKTQLLSPLTGSASSDPHESSFSPYFAEYIESLEKTTNEILDSCLGPSSNSPTSNYKLSSYLPSNVSFWSHTIEKHFRALSDAWKSSFWLCRNGVLRSGKLIGPQSKSESHKDTPSSPTKRSLKPSDNSNRIAEVTTSTLLRITESMKSMLDDWVHGYNLIVDLLSVLPPIILSDDAAFLVKGTIFEASLRTQMLLLFTAPFNIVGRIFHHLSPLSLENNSKIVSASPSITYLIQRTLPLFISAFESKRSSYRDAARTTWNATFGRCSGIHWTTLGDKFSELLQEAIKANPEQFTHKDHLLIASKTNSEMDVDPPSEETVSIPMGASIFPTDLNVKFNRKLSNGNVILDEEKDNPSAFKPISETDAPNTDDMEVNSSNCYGPTKLITAKPLNMSNSFSPKRTAVTDSKSSFNTPNSSTSITPIWKTASSTPSTSNSDKTPEKVSDLKEQKEHSIPQVLASETHRTVPTDQNPSAFNSFKNLMSEAKKLSQQAMEERNLELQELLSIQQDIASIMWAVSHRMAKI